MASSTRAGVYIQQPTGYRAFVPATLPPDPPIKMETLEPLLSQASAAVGRLDGAASTLLNPDLFVAMYVRREAVLSSQIEGTQSTLEDLLTYEMDADDPRPLKDVEEVVNYIAAMNYGLERLETLPPSSRLIREIHGKLLRGGRGAERSPGEFRTSQNWIGPGNAPLSLATFVPPPVHELGAALANFERFLNGEQQLPILVHCGLAHAHFETIHPFLDGNGRVGRLLITFLLVYRGMLVKPMLYLSHYLKTHRTAYYDHLMAVRNDGDWEGWLQFFLRGVQDTAEEATANIRAINKMREEHHRLIQEQGGTATTFRVHDLLFYQPIVTVPFVVRTLSVSFHTALRAMTQLEEFAIVTELTASRRNRRFRYSPYLALFEDAADPPAEPALPDDSSETISR
jgi:Fic family protein